tara:strand:+ start:5218 stop:5439 length:222 start_codon:yes stop_codon:yes gene_type:complete
MSDLKITVLHHKDPGAGNEVRICMESPDQSVLDTGIVSYFEQYHPSGYMTHVLSRYSVPGGERAIISRLASCE